MIISFAYTTPALLAGEKTVTRRDWVDSYARRFRPGMLVDAYDRSPRIHGKKVATIRILSVIKEPDANMPDSDYEAEGFAYLHPRGIGKAAGHDTSRAGFAAWRESGESSWVCRFELVSVEPKA